jgi:hypothetical protein
MKRICPGFDFCFLRKKYVSFLENKEFKDEVGFHSDQSRTYNLGEDIPKVRVFDEEKDQGGVESEINEAQNNISRELPLGFGMIVVVEGPKFL